MNILVTGNNGYVGSVLTELLLEKGYEVTGLDTNYYEECKVFDFKNNVRQISKDVRDISADDLKNIDCIIHLAALSNDPLGELETSLTSDINFLATVKLAQLAKKAGVKRFIYASSQSMYGVSNLDEELDEDNSDKNPLTAYAKTKWEAECELKKLCDFNFIVVCFRPSTVFGASPMLRCDIVFNNLVASAYTTGKIEIKSDGTPWRPVVHVRDVSSAFIAGLEAPEELIAGQSFNVGIKDGNYTVRQLAEAAQRAVPGSSLVFTGEHGSDSRTYKVSFKKILTVLKDYYKPEWDLDKGGKELVDLFKRIGFTEEQFRGRNCNRLGQIKYLLENNKLSKDLRWINQSK
ncbi:MAG: NAD-dependent epimerase/dehydratase [Parcubacteria group bacterium Athens0714_26]|nr:MAG: NAD-dependent epimerase/dehydratase [Parcubacteria group bacterium Athens1014_26]TSD03640.1 MAG: NAD-dependent epimerase/dehydratase [Parcubacteria group bacterium Athens0714_26]